MVGSYTIVYLLFHVYHLLYLSRGYVFFLSDKVTSPEPIYISSLCNLLKTIFSNSLMIHVSFVVHYFSNVIVV